MSEKYKKRLLVNCDGTGQAEYTAAARLVSGYETSPPVSNCARIGRATLLEDEAAGMQQLVYYQTGVGADAETGGGISQSAWGTGVTSNVREAYGFICNNYDYGDEIFITGFSRGAFTARSVAGLIGTCGILTKKGLNLFYEAVHYYRYYNDYDDKTRPPCPVSQEDGTTRQWVKGTENLPLSQRKKLPIKAVGVWDTVGALSSSLINVKWRFHNVTLGDHIENAFHMMALNEHRFYYEVTLWESPDKIRDLSNFEQCWMIGDHSNIGGSWDDQQVSDICLAWMMSRFEKLGVKFDQTYLYGEFLKFKDYTKNIAPNLPYDKWQNDPYPPTLAPRQWGEGRIHNRWYDTPLSEKGLTCGNVTASFDRNIGLYRKPVWTTTESHDTVAFTGGFIQNTNETFHPAVRYRRFCKRNANMGHNEFYPYNPGTMQKGWTWPQKQSNGAIGAPSSTAANPSGYTFERIEDNKQKKTLQYGESSMGRLEQLYLAFYDQDNEMQIPGEDKIWKQVRGGTISTDIKTSVDSVITAYKAANKPETKPKVGPGLYSGRKPAIQDDVDKFSYYESQSKQIKVGSWVGDNLLYANSSRAQALTTFTNIGEINITGKLVKIAAGYYPPEDSIRQLESCYKDGKTEIICPFPIAQLTPSAGGGYAVGVEVGTSITSVEIKARKFQGKDTFRICGFKVWTKKGGTWACNKDFDSIKADQYLKEDAPGPAWELKGFYGAYANNNVIRMGCIWGLA